MTPVRYQIPFLGYLIPFLLVVCLAAPTAALAGVCCQSDDAQVARLVSETCCCPQTVLCASDEACEYTLEPRLTTSAPTPHATAVPLAHPLSRAVSLDAYPLRRVVVRSPTAIHLAVSLPLRL